MTVTRRLVLSGLLAAPAIGKTITGRALGAEPVSYLYPAPPFLPAFVPHQLADKRGYFAANGLAMSFNVGKGGADVAKQVAVGNADLGGGVGETSMIVRANGLPVRGVALLGGRPLFHVAARKAVNIEKSKDLSGKKIGVIAFQDTSYYTLLGMLAALGIHKEDVQIQAVGAAGVTQLMIAGALDAIVAVPEWSVAIENAGVPLDYYPIDKIVPSMAQAVLTSDALTRNRPQVIKAFVGALLHALHDCMANPAAAAKDFVAAVPQQAGKEAEIESIIRRYVRDVYPTDPPGSLGKFDPDRLARIEKSYLAKGVIHTAVPVQDLYSNDFVG